MHCFGHDHDFLGLAVVDYDEIATLTCNGAQASVVRADARILVDKEAREKVNKGGGVGCAMIFDLEAKE